jgi:hypothetical protein
MSFPLLQSSDDSIGPYCNYIEYVCFTTDVMMFSEFDLGDGLEIEDIIEELKRRLDLYGAFIPYEIKRNSVVGRIADKDNFLHYFYCLYYSVQGGTSSSAVTNIFEHITDNSLKNYFCSNYSSITSIGQNSTNLKGSIEALRLKLNETKGNYDDISVNAKDGGIDVVTFKPIDARGNQVVCLTDATIGKNWKSTKKVTTKLGYWTKYIHFKVTPITCLSLVHIVDESDFFNASNDNGLIFDRTRIMRYFTSDKVISTSLTAWISNL